MKEKAILVQGSFSALVAISGYSPKSILLGNVVSKLLYDSGVTDEELLKIFYKDDRYDDFISSSSCEFDIGEICAQQLFLECNNQVYNRQTHNIANK